MRRKNLKLHLGILMILCQIAVACKKTDLQYKYGSTESSSSTPGSGLDVTTWTNPLATTTVSGIIPDASYSSKQALFTEPNLLPANIASGSTIFGVLGTAAGPYTACVDGALNASQCSTAASRYVYSASYGGRSGTCSPGSNPSACWTNAINQYVTGTLQSSSYTLNSTSTTTLPAGYYDGTTTCSINPGTVSNLSSSNIKYGVTVLGITGNYSGLMSNIGRTKGSTPITIAEETVLYAGTNSLPAGLRAIPDPALDTDGQANSHVTKVDRTGWTGVTCGLSQSSVAARIADCSSILGASATWLGLTNGNSGHADWKLVSRAGNGSAANYAHEVWRDERTGLLWSSRMTTAGTMNWCKASGAHNVSGVVGNAADPSAYCDVSNATACTGSAPCQSTVASVVSGCYEGPNFTNTGVTNTLGKAGLGISSTPAVAWRLPTMDDYMQASIDGIGFVVQDTAYGAEWTATVNSTTNAQAFYYNPQTVTLGTYARNTDRNFRCVGR